VAGFFGMHRSCSECGQNMGTKPIEHSCDEKQRLAHQQNKWAAEIRTRLESDLTNYMESPRGKFLRYLMEKRKI
jgi:hypothetical protein